MAVRVERLRLPERPHRGLLRPILGWAAFAAIVAMIRKVTREPSVTRMSDRWLASQRDTHDF